MARTNLLIPLLLLISQQTFPAAPFRGGDRPSDTPGVVLLYNPFELHIDPMERLLLINFENDPDSLYIGFEPQVFSDTVNGYGHLVIGWRRDGRVDVYHQPGLRPDPAKFDIAGKGLAHLMVREMPGALYEVGAAGVRARYAFNDLHGRPVEIRIQESNQRRRKPFGLLAPMGDAAANPSAMPLVLLHDFYFVRRRDTDFQVRVGGRSHRPDKLPLPMDFARMYFARYSPDPLIATFNPAHDGPLGPLPVPQDARRVEAGEGVLHLSWNAGMPEIARLERRHGQHTLSLAFDPPFPDLLDLATGRSVTGGFVIAGHPSTGQVSGTYRVARQQDGAVLLQLDPAGGWQPREKKWSVRLMYLLAKPFRNWPRTYLWEAVLQKTPEGEWHMRSGWIRSVAAD
jgi:hypothetical protein